MNHVQSRIKAVIEVILVYLLIYLLLSYLQLPLSNLESQELKQFLFYTLVLVIPLVLLVVTRKDFAAYGISFKNLKYHLHVTGTAFIPITILSVVLALSDWKQWEGAGVVTGVEVVLVFVIAWMLQKMPRADNLSGKGTFLVMPAILLLSTKAGNILLSIGYFYVLVAFGEEILFRGYIQSRLNEAFGRPYQFFGITWGWGLIIASLIFGLWHVLNPSTVNPFLGTYNLMWSHGLWTVFLGLILGLVREKTGSIVAPAILHGIVNFPPQAIIFAFLG
jgi:membrane protease YdiL (CAAX protease family)